MKYKLNTAGHSYRPPHDGCAALKALGFRFKEMIENDFYEPGTLVVDGDHEPEIELNTMEDLKRLRDACGHDLVFHGDSITIYDDYME